MSYMVATHSQRHTEWSQRQPPHRLCAYSPYFLLASAKMKAAAEGIRGLGSTKWCLTTRLRITLKLLEIRWVVFLGSFDLRWSGILSTVANQVLIFSKLPVESTYPNLLHRHHHCWHLWRQRCQVWQHCEGHWAKQSLAPTNSQHIPISKKTLTATRCEIHLEIHECQINEAIALTAPHDALFWS